MTKDPVCGMMVDENKTQYKSRHEAKEYYFCSSGCKNAFDKNPSKFA
jgi:Cu+-exporting ATPase